MMIKQTTLPHNLPKKETEASAPVSRTDQAFKRDATNAPKADIRDRDSRFRHDSTVSCRMTPIAFVALPPLSCFPIPWFSCADRIGPSAGLGELPIVSRKRWWVVEVGGVVHFGGFAV